MTTKEIGFADKYKSALALAESVKTVVIKTDQDFQSANEKLTQIRQFEKDLEIDYKAHPIIIEAKRLQGIKGDLATILENARKGLKNGPMLTFENEQERLRLAEEKRLADIARKEQEAETARLVAEQKAAFEKAEKARKAAEKNGDEEAAERARLAAEQAAATAKDIKADAAMAPTVTVVVEKTAPSVPRRMTPKFRVIDESKIPRQYFSLDMVKVGGVIRSLKQNHGIPGIEYYEEPS